MQTNKPITYKFTSLTYALLRLQEAEYFLGQLSLQEGSEFQFHLNAFLSAGRSVTFVLQKSMKEVHGFRDWYGLEQASMKSDAAMAFFLELRNISQKEGPVLVVGGSTSCGWGHRFAGNSVPVPPELKGKDVVLACSEHVVKLGKLIAACQAMFPYDSCPVTALCPKGMEHLGYDLNDFACCLGLPSGYLEVAAEIPVAEKLAYLRREFEPLDLEEIARITSGKFLRDGEPLILPTGQTDGFLDDLAELIEGRDGEVFNSKEAFLRTFAKRVRPQDN
ncbi:MAG: hypothetical protein P8Q48_21370 [Paracoccaceae bacterium]|nr:hypothetical protein [Paracoccaceae bacterium]